MTSTLNSSPRLTEDDLPKNLFDYLTSDRKPLIDGTKVGISQDLINQTEVANQVRLPGLEPDEAMIAPVADKLSDAEIEEHIQNTLLSTVIIASTLLAVRLLNCAHGTRRSEIVRVFERLVGRQDEMPKKVPASKLTEHPLSWHEGMKSFLLNWSSLAAGLLATSLVSMIFIEVLYQISALRESSWGLVQSFFGAFGFSWGFTVAVVVATYWHSATFSLGLNVRRSKKQRETVEALTRDEAHDHFKRTLSDTKWSTIRGWHAFRHSFCSNCAAAGVDQRIINAWVGHQTEEMVKRYRHLIPNQQQEAITKVFEMTPVSNSLELNND